MSAFLAGLFIGLIGGLTVGLVRGKRSRNNALFVADKQPDEARFGHPKPPLKTLRDRLPHAPAGCAWESSIQYDDRGEPSLHLSLIEVLTEKTIASTKASLVRRRYETYSETYRKYKLICGDIFNQDLIGPLVDWATSQVNKYANAGKTYGYRMEA